MSDTNGTTPPKSPEDVERERAHAAWERGELAPEGEPEPVRRVGLLDRLLRREPWREADADADGYVRPPRRSIFPPSFLVLAAAGVAVLALEPTADLGYHLFGPKDAIDLGHPGDYHLSRAADGARAKVIGFASSRRGTFSQFGHDYEVVALAGTAVLVRRDPTPQPPANTAEFYQGEGRLLKLEEAPSSFVERLVRPASRYTSLRHAFAARGEIPPGRTAWLLLEGEVPRSNAGAIALPLAAWAFALFLAFKAFVAWRERQTAHLRVPRART